MLDRHETRPGVGVDAHGGAVIDPSENVARLNEASSSRQDDLRAAFDRRVTLAMEHVGLVATMRHEHQTNMLVAERRRVDGELALRAEFQEKLSLAEAKRIDAIRSVDVAAVAVASERAAQQATVLANQVAASAEALRGIVASTAASVDQKQQAFAAAFMERLQTLERSGYENKGRQALADPQTAELVAEMRRMVIAQSQGQGKSSGLSTAWAIVVAGVGLIGTVLGAAAIFLR